MNKEWTYEEKLKEIETDSANILETRSLLREILAAYTSGNLRMTSHDVGDPESGIPLRPWHEEWMTGVREALGEKGDED